MAFVGMRRKTVLLCMLLAVAQRVAGQGQIGRELLCQDPNEDPDPNNPNDNLSCPNLNPMELDCYSTAELCNGNRVCSGGSDEGDNIVALECNNRQFACSPGVFVTLDQLCDGNEDCIGNGDDETTTLCENKCLLPYYGGCSYTRVCVTSEFDVNCGGCLPGLVTNPADVGGDCLVEIGLRRTFYTGSEENQLTESICAAILINPADLANGLSGLFTNLNLNQIIATITPTQRTGANAATAVTDYDNQVRVVSLTAAQPEACVEIPIEDDAVFDPDELFDVVLATNAARATVRAGLERAQVSINDNDAEVIAVYQQDVYNVQEGDGSVGICVAIISPTVSQLTATSSIRVTFTGGSASVPQDYQQVASPSATLVFPAGSSVTNSRTTSSSQCFTVPIGNDNINEQTETFSMGLADETGLITIAPNLPGDDTLVVITDDDQLVTAVYQLPQYNVNEDAGGILICVAIVSPTVTQLTATSSVAVNFLGGGTASAPQDYQQVATPSDVLNFFSGSSVTNNPATSSSQCFTVPITDDALVESPETFIMGLTGNTGLIAINQGQPGSQTTVTIIDDDQFVTAVYQPNSYAVNEPDGTVQICVAIISNSPVQSTLSAASTVEVTFADVTASGSAPNQDYVPAIIGNAAGILSFSNGDLVTNDPTTSSSRCFFVSIINDNLIEPPESFILGLDGETGLIIVNDALPASRATVLINNDDFPIVGLDPTFYLVNENMPGALEVCVELFSVGTLPGQVPVFLTTDDNTATAPMDYGPFSNRQLTFPAGSGFGDTVCTNVDIRADNILELTGENFFVDLAVTGNTVIEQNRERATIMFSPDMAVFRFVPNSYTTPEGNIVQAVCIQLSGGVLSQAVDLTIQTANINAIAGLDYTGINRVFSFPAGSTQECIDVPILDDDVVEADEPFLVNGALTIPVQGVAFVDGPATVTIIDTDRAVVRIVPRPPGVPEEGGPTTVCVELQSGSFAPGQSGILTLSTNNGGAQSPGDFTSVSMQLTFTFLNSDQMLCVDIPINDDILCEGLENFNVAISTNDQDLTLGQPSALFLNIIDNDVAEIGLDVVEPAMFQGMVQECADEELVIRINFDSVVRKGPNRQCVITVRTEDGSAEAGSDYAELDVVCILTASNTFCEYPIEIMDDFDVEMDEYFSIILESNDPTACDISDENTTIVLKDDEDCDNDVCGEFEMCEELMCPDNFTCIPEGVGDDPHFAVTLSTGKTLCYTVQGEHGFAFNLISNSKMYMNAMFVPDARREEVTWLGTMGIIINNNGFKKSNMTKLRFEAIKNKIHIDDQMVLEARNIERITFENGKLTISEAPPTEGYKQPFVRVDLKDVELSFSIKFMTEHLDLYWHSTGQKTVDSHGLIGQFFRDDVSLDEVRKILILPGKEPVPVQRKPLWAFMERESGDSSNFCWVAMNPGYQGDGLIDGSYFDYLVDDVLSTEFKFKKL